MTVHLTVGTNEYEPTKVNIKAFVIKCSK